MAPPTSGFRRLTAYQMPIPAITSGTSSFDSAASTPNRPASTRRSWSRAQIMKRSSGIANVTGWKSLREAHCTAG